MANIDGIVNIHGKDYQTVAYRLILFRADYPKGSILTEMIKDEDGVIVFKATIKDGDLCLATGYAEEVRGSSNIHKTSALEIAETSSVGRALAFAGYHGTASIASADEVSVAMARQAKPEPRCTKKQVEAIGKFLDNQEDGVRLSQKLLNRAAVDHLKELEKWQAAAFIKRWGIDV